MLKLLCFFACALQVAFVLGAPNPDVGCDKPPMHKKHPNECCEIPMIFEKAEMEACEMKFGKSNHTIAAGQPPKDPAMVHDCFAECLFNATKALVKGTIDVTLLKAYIKGKTASAVAWQPVLEKAIDDCMAESTPKTTPAPSATTNQCNPRFGQLMMCTVHKAFQNCPPSIYKASAECDELKSFATKCPIPHHM